MVTQQDRAKGSQSGFDVNKRHFIATHMRGLLNYFVLSLVLCDPLANGLAKACNNKGKKV